MNEMIFMIDGKKEAENANSRQARSLKDMMFSSALPIQQQTAPSPPDAPQLQQEEKPTEKTYTKDEVRKIVEEESQKAYDDAREDFEKEKPKKESEWRSFQKMGMNMPNVLETDYEHKAWLLTSKFLDKPTIQLHDLAIKELRIANLPDTELALVYAFKMDCVEDWLSVGYGDLAKQRLIHMLFRLGLSVSVDAKELTLQHGQSNVSMTLPMSEHQYTGLPEDDEAPKPKINIRKFLGRFK